MAAKVRFGFMDNFETIFTRTFLVLEANLHTEVHFAMILAGREFADSECVNTRISHCVICEYPLEVIKGEPATCERCGRTDHRHSRHSAKLCLVFSLTAMIFYVPANIFPFMTIEMYGRTNSSTIWSGIVQLLDQRSYFVGGVVFLASMLIPIMKLLILFYLSLTGSNGQRTHFKMKLYRFVEAIGRWSMLDIFLLAILVAIVKLGHFTTVTPERGSTLFLFVVIFTMMASAYFDPRILWEKENEKTDSATRAST